MPRPFSKIGSAESDEGVLELHQRGEDDFMILVGGRVLMTSTLKSSELFLAQAGCAALSRTSSPRVLIGGLGLGFTLRAALDALPKGAHVVVCELNEAVVEWCRGPVAKANGRAALDPRVRIVLGDVTREISRVADSAHEGYDAILWDLYVGPTRQGQDRHPLYGTKSVQRIFAALNENGVFGVWCETPSASFERRLEAAGFSIELERTRGKGLRHAVYLAHKRPLPHRPARDQNSRKATRPRRPTHR